MSFPRSNDDSFARGVISERLYRKGNARSIVSLKMCFMGWLYELIASFMAILSPTLHKYGMPNTYMIDPILMFVVIPLVHLLNDEETKGIITEENWYQGLRYMMGIYNEPPHPSTIPQTSRAVSCKISSASHVITIKDQNKITSHEGILVRRCNSAPKLFSSDDSASLKKSKPLQKSNSLSHLISE